MAKEKSYYALALLAIVAIVVIVAAATFFFKSQNYSQGACYSTDGDKANLFGEAERIVPTPS
jgi:uncharacterized protein YxeA